MRLRHCQHNFIIVMWLHPFELKAVLAMARTALQLSLLLSILPHNFLLALEASDSLTAVAMPEDQGNSMADYTLNFFLDLFELKLVFTFAWIEMGLDVFSLFNF